MKLANSALKKVISNWIFVGPSSLPNIILILKRIVRSLRAENDLLQQQNFSLQTPTYSLCDVCTTCLHLLIMTLQTLSLSPYFLANISKFLHEESVFLLFASLTCFPLSSRFKISFFVLLMLFKKHIAKYT